MSLSIDKNQSPEIDVRGRSSLKKRKEKEETLFNQTYMHALPIHIDWYDILKKKKKKNVGSLIHILNLYQWNPIYNTWTVHITF